MELVPVQIKEKLCKMELVPVQILEKLCRMEFVLVLLTRLCKMVLVQVRLLILPVKGPGRAKGLSWPVAGLRLKNTVGQVLEVAYS